MSCIRYILNWWAYRPRRCQRCQNHLHSYRVRCEGCGRWIGPACHPERCWAIEAIQFCHRTLCRDCWREWPSRRLRLLTKEPPLPLRIVLNHGWLALTRPPPCRWLSPHCSGPSRSLSATMGAGDSSRAAKVSDTGSSTMICHRMPNTPRMTSFCCRLCHAPRSLLGCVALHMLPCVASH